MTVTKNKHELQERKSAIKINFWPQCESLKLAKIFGRNLHPNECKLF